MDFSSDGKFLFIVILKYGLRILDVSNYTDIKIALQVNKRIEFNLFGITVDNSRRLVYAAAVHDNCLIFDYSNLYLSPGIINSYPIEGV